MNKILVAIFALLILISCNLSNQTTFLSGNSFFSNKGGHRKIKSRNTILHRTDIYEDILDHNCNDEFIIAKQSPQKEYYIASFGFDLYTRYTAYSEYKKDSNIIKRNAWRDLKGKIEMDSINYEMFFERGASLGNSSQDIQISRKIADSLIQNDPYYMKVFSNKENYWIIDNAKDTLIGPLTKAEYLSKRKELKVPDDLQLE